MLLVMLGLACSPDKDEDTSAEAGWDFWEAGPSLRGSGGPTRTFADDELWQACAFLEGGPGDFDHHNLVVPYRGHLVMPWSPEFGTGGISLFDMADPCAPVKAGEGIAPEIRESHALGFFHLQDDGTLPDPAIAGDWMVSTGVLGILTWDLSDPAEPTLGAYLQIPGVFYPDSYTYVVLSVSVQYPWLFVGAADNGVFVVDISDPREPVLVSQYLLEPALRVGGVFAMGTLMLVTSAEQNEAAMLDISQPDAVAPIPGGRFATADELGVPKETYHGNHAGDLAFFARKEDGGGFIAVDISDPTAPTTAGGYLSNGNGGYVFYDEGVLFEGESDIARYYDVTDLSAPVLLGEATLTGDLDTNTPWGNVSILSVDEDAEGGQATSVVPWATAPDTTPIAVRRVVPADGEQGVATSARIGVVLSEFVEPASVWPGSLRLRDGEGAPVPGWTSTQENTATYTPVEPLLPGTTYTVEVEGLTDINGNALSAPVITTFTTAG